MFVRCLRKIFSASIINFQSPIPIILHNNNLMFFFFKCKFHPLEKNQLYFLPSTVKPQKIIIP